MDIKDNRMEKDKMELVAWYLLLFCFAFIAVIGSLTIGKNVVSKGQVIFGQIISKHGYHVVREFASDPTELLKGPFIIIITIIIIIITIITIIMRLIIYIVAVFLFISALLLISTIMNSSS